MSIFLILTFLFAVGSFLGWVLEVLYRHFASKKWVNPGFLTGPWLPIYGFSLCVLYLLTLLEPYIKIGNVILEKAVLFAVMAVVITCIEYAAGLIFIKKMKIKLWDYSDKPGNIQGIICPLFSFYWMILSAVYYFLIHPHILDMLDWLSKNLAFSFGIGFYFGIMSVDMVYSFRVIYHIKRFAEEKQIVVRLEEFKGTIQEHKRKRGEHFQFLLSYHSVTPLREHLERYFDSSGIKERFENIRSRINKNDDSEK
ncbi:MAG: putative ABC transporter permease [Ruminococcus sp.]